MYNSKIFLKYLLIFLGFSLFGCESKVRLERVDFNDTVKVRNESVTEGFVLNVCVGSIITPKEGYVYYKELLDYVSDKLELKLKFIEKKTYLEVNEGLRKEEIDVAFVCGGPYIAGHDEFGLELLAAPVVNGKSEYYSYIIVGKNSGIERFSELRGKTFAFADPMSNTGKLVPTYMLYKLKETPDEYFKQYIYTYSHDKSIKAVAHGIVDGAGVDSLIWRFMDKNGKGDTKKTRIIKVSAPYGIPPVVVRPGLDAGLKKRLQRVFLKMDGDVSGRSILEGMCIEKFTKVDDSHYNSIRELKKVLK